jgi:hypothetical protein
VVWALEPATATDRLIAIPHRGLRVDAAVDIGMRDCVCGLPQVGNAGKAFWAGLGGHVDEGLDPPSASTRIDHFVGGHMILDDSGDRGTNGFPGLRPVLRQDMLNCGDFHPVLNLGPVQPSISGT